LDAARAYVNGGGDPESFRVAGVSRSFLAGSVSADSGVSIDIGDLNIPVPSLKYQTISGCPTCKTWRIAWSLSRPTPIGGVIVQHVQLAFSTYDYFEAWSIQPGYLSADNTDTFNASRVGVKLFAKAAFYEGLSTNDLVNTYGFGTNPAPEAGALLSTTDSVSLPSSTRSLFVDRVWRH
jgi:hypothetical protein